MTFKDVLEKDIKETFLNVETLGEELDIGGTKYKGVLDFRDSIESKSKGDGINQVEPAFLYLKSTPELLKSYRVGKIIEVNEKIYLIESLGHHMGLLTFKLIENIGY